MANKIDSNLTGLRICEEASLKTLLGTSGDIWYPYEPNSYSDFGGSISTVARNPINSSRQRQKGVTTDLDASGGFNTDVTKTNLLRLLQGAFFADIEEKYTTAPMNGAAVVFTNVATSTDTFTASGATDLDDILVGALVQTQGFTNDANNGILNVVSRTTTTVVVSENLVDEAAPPASAVMSVVGHKFGSAEFDITVSGTVTRLARVGGSFDLTTLPLMAGEWICLNSDTSSERFANNRGFARIKTIAATYLEFDKTTWTPVAEVGTAKTIAIWFGSMIRNRPEFANITRRTYQLERTLGIGRNGSYQQAEYLVGAVLNEFSLQIPQADKVTADLAFVAMDVEQKNSSSDAGGTDGLKVGTRPSLDKEAAFNTSSDVSRIKMSVVGSDPAPTPLFAYVTEFNLTLTNNVTPNKAVGVLGAFDTTAGTFEVGGSVTAYFADVDAVSSVRHNDDVTIDVLLQKSGYAILFDIPLLSLGDGRLSVEQDQPITLPLELMAAESSFGHTLLFQYFPYLPI